MGAAAAAAPGAAPDDTGTLPVTAPADGPASGACPSCGDRQPGQRAVLRELRLRLHHRRAAASAGPADPAPSALDLPADPRPVAAAGQPLAGAGRHVGGRDLDRPRLVRRPAEHRPAALARPADRRPRCGTPRSSSAAPPAAAASAPTSTSAPTPASAAATPSSPPTGSAGSSRTSAPPTAPTSAARSASLPKTPVPRRAEDRGAPRRARLPRRLDPHRPAQGRPRGGLSRARRSSCEVPWRRRSRPPQVTLARPPRLPR